MTAPWLRSLLLGSAAGLAVFLLDLALAAVTLGSWPPLRPHYPLVYAIAGGALALLVRLGHTVFWSRRKTTIASPTRAIFVWTAFLLYAPSVFERVEQAVRIRNGRLAAALAATVALAAYGLWAWVLVRLWRREADSGGGRNGLRPGMLLAALTVGLGLAVNRSLVNQPTETGALLLDGVIVVGVLALTLAARRWGWRGGAAAAAAALGALLLTVATLGVSPMAGPTPPGSSAPGVQRPNLMLVIVDTLRHDVFRAVVEETEEGRRLRRALGGALWLDHAIAAAPWTAPSVGSILTGLYPPEHGFGRGVGDPNRPLRRLSGSVRTLAEYLGHRGYQSVAVVTNPLLYPGSGIARGFGRYELLQSGTRRLPLLLVLMRSGLLADELYQPARRARRHLERHFDRWIDPRRPWFLWLHLMDPHAPAHRHRDLTADPAARALPASDRLYRDEARYALRELAVLLEDLDRQPGFRANTLLVIVADHGEMFPSDRHFNGVFVDGERKVSGHGHAYYDELVRVPLVIRPPGGLDGERRLSGQVSQVDLFANLVEALGLERPRTAAPRLRFAPWLRPVAPLEPFAGREVALSSANQFGAPHRSLRSATRKLIHYPGGERPDELYDLAADPGEHHDLAAAHLDELRAAIALEERLWAQLEPATATPPAELDAETRRQLEALGYL